MDGRISSSEPRIERCGPEEICSVFVYAPLDRFKGAFCQLFRRFRSN